MSSNGDSAEKRPGLPITWPAVLLVAVGLYAYLTFKPPLQSARPPIAGSHEPGPPSVPEVGAIYARLWDDPLEPAYQDNARRASEEGEQTDPLSELLQGLNIFEQKEGDEGGQIKRLSGDGFFKIVERAREREDTNHKLLVMPVLLRGGPCGVNREDRMRIRYAVLAALSHCGYALELPTRMSYARLRVNKYFRVLDYHDADWYTTGGGNDCQNCANVDGSGARTMRGGDWQYTTLSLRAAERFPGTAGAYWLGSGIRCARD